MNKLLHDTSSTWNWNFSLSFSLWMCAVQCSVVFLNVCTYLFVCNGWFVSFIRRLKFSSSTSTSTSHDKWTMLVDGHVHLILLMFLFFTANPISSTPLSVRLACVFRQRTNLPEHLVVIASPSNPFFLFNPVTPRVVQWEKNSAFSFLIGKQQQQQQQYHIYAIHTQTPI